MPRKRKRQSRHMNRGASYRDREIAVAKRLGIAVPEKWTFDAEVFSNMPPAIRFQIAMYHALIERQPEFRFGPGRKRGSKAPLADLVTKEAVRVPPEFAAEMVAYDATVGEFRVHYAGFFDPGFGWDAPTGAKAVLEVRSHEVPFMLEHGQTVGWLRYEPMAAAPDRLYGANIGSSYQSQTLRLAKQFRQT